MQEPYQLVLDFWEANHDVEPEILKAEGIAGWVVRLNAINGGLHLDDRFEKNWALAKTFPAQTVYFVYNPWVSGQANFDWLMAHLPADYGRRRLMVDLEVRYSLITPKQYAAQVAIFAQQVKQRFPLANYSGGGFLDLLDPWPAGEEYWWAGYSDSLTLCKTWDQYKRTLTGLNYASFTRLAPGACRMWQCSGDGVVLPGFGGHAVDVNAFPGTLEDLRAWFNIPSTETNPDPGGTMWNEGYAILGAFDPISGYAPVANIDFAALKASGLDGALISLGTSADSLNYADPYAGHVDYDNRFARIAAAKAAGVLAIGEYAFSAVMDSLNYTAQWTKQHLNWLMSGQGKPQGGVMLTCERNTWYEGTQLKTCNANMLIQDLRALRDWMYPSQGLVAGIRSGRWFLNLGINFADGFLDLINAGGQDNCPYFGVYLMKSKETVTDFKALMATMPDPEITTVPITVGKDASGKPIIQQVNLQAHFLYIGNFTKWRGWECAWVYHPAVTDASGKPALFRLILWRGSVKDLYAYFNVPYNQTTPPDDGNPDDGTPGTGIPGDYATKVELQAVQAEVAALKANQVKSVTVQIERGV